MKNPIPRLAAIHDLSGLGKVSLMVVIPILSTMGVQVTPLVTAVLSSNTEYADFKMLDLTEQMTMFFEHWKNEGIKLDAIYSGFLGSDKQIDIVKELIDFYKHEELLVVVDPVLGDDGKPYAPMSLKLIEEMKKLICKANLITPNTTEVCLLLDEPYNSQPNIEQVKEWALRLSEQGPENVVITGVHNEQNPHLTGVIAYTRSNSKFWRVSCTYIPASYPGTGDIFTSVVTGSLLQGDSLPIAIDRAVQFTSQAIRSTFGRDRNIKEGVLIEKVLDGLKSPIFGSNYEII